MTNLAKELTALAQQMELSLEVVEYCYEAGLVQHPASDTDLAELRRARRLQRLEVNPPGIEIILHMRRRMVEMQREMATLTAEMEAAQTRFEQKMRELRRRLAQDI